MKAAFLLAAAAVLMAPPASAPPFVGKISRVAAELGTPYGPAVPSGRPG